MLKTDEFSAHPFDFLQLIWEHKPIYQNKM